MSTVLVNRVTITCVVVAAVIAAVVTVLATAATSTAALPAAARAPLPARMRSTGGGTQLITVVGTGTTNAARSGTLTWWQRRGTTWVRVGSAPARFGYNGLADSRVEGDGTTPTGVYPLPEAFGIRRDPGTKLRWHHVDAASWWDENSRDRRRYNTWYKGCPRTICFSHRAHASEHLADYPVQYAYAVVIGFNTGARKVRAPARPSGSGIFLHVNGAGSTAGCVSIPRSSLVALLRWLDPAAKPHIAIGTSASITRF